MCLQVLSSCGNGRTTNGGVVDVESVHVNASSEYSCGAKHFCSEMSTCKEAKYYHEACNINKLDRDNDGIPCESLCL